ncbi:uncharacterized protein METZ01_LOCUS197595 [marine metagenome]|uniref:Sialidase domain-containing protein n=1 Tax=marine metagenome TaxID=408172 RepID=A0A382E417_9ZZZZ
MRLAPKLLRRRQNSIWVRRNFEKFLEHSNRWLKPSRLRKDLAVRVGGPDMIQIPDGRLVAAVRFYGEEECWGRAWISPYWIDADAGTISEFQYLPSGGDTSYAVMVWHEDRLWVSYYSSHEKKTSIYLARVRLT